MVHHATIAKAMEDHRTPRRFRVDHVTMNFRQVLKCAAPAALFGIAHATANHTNYTKAGGQDHAVPEAGAPGLMSPSATIREIRGLKNPRPKQVRLRHCSGGVQRIKATA